MGMGVRGRRRGRRGRWGWAGKGDVRLVISHFEDEHITCVGGSEEEIGMSR